MKLACILLSLLIAGDIVSAKALPKDGVRGSHRPLAGGLAAHGSSYDLRDDHALVGGGLRAMSHANQRKLQTPCGDGFVGTGTCTDPTLCCSTHGWCGSTADHCAGGGGSGDSDGACGDGDVGNGVCADSGLCCSAAGWCGSTADHCAGGSDGACGNGDVGNGVCADSGLCCSAAGWCGSTADHCAGETGGGSIDSSSESTDGDNSDSIDDGELAVITYHNYYEGQSTNELACSDGANGLQEQLGIWTLGNDNMLPYVSATSNIVWNSPNCGACYELQSDIATIHVTAIDACGPGGSGEPEMHFDMHPDAFAELFGSLDAGKDVASFRAVDPSNCKGNA